MNRLFLKSFQAEFLAVEYTIAVAGDPVTKADGPFSRGEFHIVGDVPVSEYKEVDAGICFQFFPGEDNLFFVFLFKGFNHLFAIPAFP